MSRPIGAGVRTACRILEELGAARVSDVQTRMPGMNRAAVYQSLRRAVKFGLMDAAMEGTAWWFSLTPDWELRLERYGKVDLSALPQRTEWRYPHPWAALQAAQRACL
jgi:hypothetical protein